MSAKIWVIAGLLASAVPAVAQTQTPPDQTRNDTQRFDGRDAVGTSAVGDIGLFFVPTADTNGRGRFRGSAARTSRNGIQGQSNVADFTGSFSFGVASRADVFVSWDAAQRVDRDISPLFDPTDSRGGGVEASAPYARDTWSGNRRADLRVGGKVKVLDELGGAPVSIALRGMGRLPTGDAEDGGGVGAPRYSGEAIVSRWISSKFVMTGSVGAEQRNNPSEPVGFQVPPQMTWGTGIGYLPAETLLLHAELFGEHPFKRDTANLDQALVAVDGSLSPIQNNVDNHRAVATGLTWMARSGFFIGAAAKFDFPTLERANRTSLADYTDLQVRLGWRPGFRRVTAISDATPTPAPPPAAAPEPAPAAPAAPPAAPAPAAPAAPPAAAAREFVFEDVYFDFDRYSLRPEALRLLDEAVNSLNQTKTTRLVIEGHTCNIGTAEYNMALGERRAHAVYQYLVDHGIAVTRLRTVTYGEERPKFDNSREETRRLNRRAAMVVRVETTDNDR